MPWRLHRYLLAELLRIIGLTTLVLVVVTAFGAVIKPLAAGLPLGPGQIALYVLLSTVPMLQYALPFAAGFGTTLVIHRLASDNEVVAMAAAGLPYRTILGPVVALAIGLSVGLTVLANTGIPNVMALMGRVLRGDVIMALEHAVANGKPMKLGDMQIWAEGITLEPHADGSGDRVILSRVAAAEVAGSGAIAGDVSARAAVLDFAQRDGLLQVHMVMEDAVSWDADGGGLRGFPRIEPTHPVVVPLPERAEPAAMTWWQMDEALATPTRYPPVRRAHDVLGEAMFTHDVDAAIDRRLATGDGLMLHSADRPGQVWHIKADALVDGLLSNGARQVHVRNLHDGAPVATYTPAQARLQVRRGGPHADAPLQVMLHMREVEVAVARDDVPANRRAAVDVANLRFDPPLALQLVQDNAILAAARERGGALQSAVNGYDSNVRRLEGQVTSRRWRRFALGLTAGLLPLLGAVLALRMRYAQPLAVYMVAFVPGLMDLMLISGGTGTIRNGDLALGLGVMFSGTALVVGAIAFTWRRVARN